MRDYNTKIIASPPSLYLHFRKYSRIYSSLSICIGNRLVVECICGGICAQRRWWCCAGRRRRPRRHALIEWERRRDAITHTIVNTLFQHNGNIRQEPEAASTEYIYIISSCVFNFIPNWRALKLIVYRGELHFGVRLILHGNVCVCVSYEYVYVVHD